MFKLNTAIFMALISASQANAFPGTGPLGDYSVEIQNLTQSQPLTPPVIEVGGTQLFQVGKASSEALREVAEDGDLSGFQAMQNPSVRFAFGLGPILPGESKVYYVNRPTNYSAAGLSLVSMLGRTNDAFIGIESEEVYSPAGGGLMVGDSREIYARVYDAGTEANTELCAHIPAPPCNSVNARFTSGAEGFVYLHSGLHYMGDLTARDAFGPFAAKVTIRRLR